MGNIFKPTFKAGKSSCWYGKIKSGPKQWEKVRLYTDKESSRRELAKLQATADQRAAGVRTLEMDHAGVGIDQHITDYIIRERPSCSPLDSSLLIHPSEIWKGIDCQSAFSS